MRYAPRSCTYQSGVEGISMMSDDTIQIPMPGMAADGAVAVSGRPGDLTEQLITTSIWSDAMLAAAGIPVIDVPFVSVGGGLGSFIMTNFLRIAGVPVTAIRVLGAIDTPWQTYEYLTRVSQIPRGERLRSDSSSTPDNIWGFPS